MNDSALWERLYTAIETQGFFSRQAEALGGFEQATADLEQRLLPRAVNTEDWPRFLHYAQVAIHFRGLAEALGEERVVEALERAGRSQLAENLVSQLSDPVRRARLRAATAAALPRSGEEFGNRIESVRQDLKEASAERPEAWCEALEGVARHLGTDLRARWPEWVESLPAGPVRDRVWKAVAESFLHQGDLEAPALWQALTSIEDPGALLSFLPERLVSLAPPDPWTLLERLAVELDRLGPSILWRLALPWASTARDPGVEVLRRLAEELGAPVWTVELVEAGHALWLRLTEAELDSLDWSIPDPIVRAALRVVTLEAAEEPLPSAALQAFAGVEAMPAGPEQLHWALRLLAARGAASVSSRAGSVAAVARHLARLRYAASAEDLVRFLDLVAAVFPKALRRQLENVLWAPESDSDTLRALAHTATHPRLLEELLERAEEYAALVAETSAEGFELRCEVLVDLARILCVMKGNLEPFETACERMLPEEEDTLRQSVARGLAAAGRRGEAAKVAADIASGRSRLGTLLEALPAEAELERRDLLTPEALYRAVADPATVSDELGALAALLEEPRKPDEVARAHLDDVQSPGRRIEALVDLAHHALTWQENSFSPSLQDRLAAVLPLKQALGVVESDLWLVRLTPELVDVGARLGPKQAMAEVQEAWERVIGLQAVDWTTREEILVALLARLGRILPDAPKRLRGLLEWLARSPSAMAAGPGREELRSQWHQLFPWLAAVKARLPDTSRKSWARQGLAKWRRTWDWLAPEQEKMLAVSFTSREERLRLAQEVEQEEGWAWVLASRLTADAPEIVPGLLMRMGSNAERDRLGLLLLTGGWLPPRVGEELLPLLSEEGHARTWGEVWLGVSGRTSTEVGAEDRWIHAVAGLAAGSEIASSDPRTAPLRRRLWEVDESLALPELAGSVPAALASGGKQGGEAALRLFLNAHLPPTWGRGDRLRLAVWELAKEAEFRAGRLDRHEGTPARARAGPGPDGVPSPARLDSIQRGWSRVAHRGPRSSPWAGSVREVLTLPLFLFLMASALFLVHVDAPFWLHPHSDLSPVVGRAMVPWLSMLSLFLVLFLFLAQAVLVDRFLAGRFVRESRTGFIIRGFRFLLAGTPILGLLTIPAWKALMAAEPKRSIAQLRARDRIQLQTRSGVGPRLGRLPGRRLIERGLASVWTLVVLFLTSFFWVYAPLAFPLAVDRILHSQGGLDALPLLSLSLHSLAFVCVAVALALRSHALGLSEHQRAVYLGLSVFWLMPHPMAAFLGLML